MKCICGNLDVEMTIEHDRSDLYIGVAICSVCGREVTYSSEDPIKVLDALEEGLLDGTS